MATYSAKGSINEHYTLKLIVSETEVNQADNTSEVAWEVQLVSSGGYNFREIGSTVTVTINGTQVYSNYAQRSISVNGTLKIASGTTSAIAHNDNGSKSVTCTAQWSQNSSASYTPGNTTATGTLALTNIQRYATVSQSSPAKEINTITMNWSSNATIDYVWYSKDNGSTWTAVGSVNSTSGTYYITGLNPNSTYNIKTRVRRADSQLTTDSTALSVTTYDYARFSNLANMTIGGTMTVGITNPSGAPVKLYVTNANQDIFVVNDLSISAGTTYLNSSNYNLGNMYLCTPNSNTGAIRYIIKTSVNGSNYWVSEDKYIYVDTSINKPTFSNFTFADTNSSILALTGNNQIFVQGQSTATVTIATANKAVAKNGATMSRYRITVGSNSAQEISYSSSNNITATFTAVTGPSITVSAIDSRGNQTSITKTATWKQYFIPYYNSLSFKRENGVGQKVYFDLSATYKEINFGAVNNAILQADYRWVVKGQSNWSSWIKIYDSSIPGGEYNKIVINGANITESTNNNFLTADYSNTYLDFTTGTEYYIQLRIFDKIVNSWSGQETLNSGIPGMARRQNSNGTYSYGINCFPRLYQTFAINGEEAMVIGNNGDAMNGVNANDLTKSGMYYLGIDCTNVPQNYVRIFVNGYSVSDGGNDIVQIAVEVASVPNMWIRSKVSGTWRSWRLQARGYIGYIGEGTDFNTLNYQANFIYGGQSAINSPPNYGVLEIIKTAEYVLQRCTGDGIISTRNSYNSGSTWTNWEKVVINGVSSISAVGANALSLFADGSNHTYMQFFARYNSGVRSGYIGYGANGTNSMHVYNEIGDLYLISNSGHIYANDKEIKHVQSGSVTITPVANTPTGVHINFPTAFATEPSIALGAYTAVPGTTMLGVGYSNLSTTGVDLYLTRTNTGATTVSWVAVC